jgi:DNA sulfur modification protein DndD
LGNSQDERHLLELETAITTLTEQSGAVYLELGGTRNALEEGHTRLKQLEAQFRAQGGELYDQRNALQARLSECRRVLDLHTDQLRDLGAGDLPLVLLRKSIESVRSEAEREQESTRACGVLELLLPRDAALEKRLISAHASREILDVVRTFLDESRSELSEKADRPRRLGTVPLDFAGLDDAALQGLQSTARRQLNVYRTAETDVATADGNVLAIPAESVVLGLIASIDKSRTEVAKLQGKVAALEEEHKRLHRELESKKRAHADEHDRYVVARLGDEVTMRIIRHARRTRETLSSFRADVASRNLRRLETLIAASFQQLLRKTHLVKAVHIDPITYALEIRDAHGDPLPPSRLSAGERQLLAVSILWSLAKASGRLIPTIIDTPLGRLDGVHRRLLVNNYFPRASHQVLLLSTDEEIDLMHHQVLRPHIAREYLIEHDENGRSSLIKPGYFSNQVAVA